MAGAGDGSPLVLIHGGPARGPAMPSVLIVADEFHVAESWTRLLTAAGYDEPWHAATFETALAVALLTRPSVTLVDHRLSGSQIGVAFARHLRQLGVKVVYVTDHVDDVRRADPGAVILSKPCDPLALLHTLQRVIRSAQA